MSSIKLFVGSFNVNGQDLPDDVVRQWLTQADGADVVALGFQECRYVPAKPFPPPCNSQTLHPKSGSLTHAYLRGDVEQDREETWVSTIVSALPEMELVADVAIGEPPTPGKVDLEGKTVEWYGTTRLMVFTATVLRLHSRDVWSYVIPAGDKPSMYHKEWGHYAKDCAPDKGAVGVYLQPLNLLLLNCHLHGTNKYDVPESVFDKHRLRQLHKIHASLQPAPPGLDPPALVEGVAADGYAGPQCRMVVLGDLNFRTEMCSEPGDKAKGGNDWQSVAGIAKSSDVNDLQTLFEGSDRLYTLLTYIQTDKIPALLRGCQDALDVALRRNQAIPPTFTYKPYTPEPRKYETKRTPSWTDRVLWRGFEPLMFEFSSIKSITISDHEPVYAVLGLEHLPQEQKRPRFTVYHLWIVAFAAPFIARLVFLVLGWVLRM